MTASNAEIAEALTPLATSLVGTLEGPIQHGVVREMILSRLGEGYDGGMEAAGQGVIRDSIAVVAIQVLLTMFTPNLQKMPDQAWNVIEAIAEDDGKQQELVDELFRRTPDDYDREEIENALRAALAPHRPEDPFAHLPPGSIR